MIPVLLLIIPFHGIFLSLFFFFQGEHGRGPNFFLGLMILIISLLSLFQQLHLPCKVLFSLHSPHSFFQELLICPFLFVYTSTMIRPRLKKGISSHLVIISTILFLILSLSWFNVLTNNILVIFLSLINGFYLLASLTKLIELIRKDDAEIGHIQISRYSWIIILHALVVSALLINLCIWEMHLIRSIFLIQIPKGLIIYYTYYKILDNARFAG